MGDEMRGNGDRALGNLLQKTDDALARLMADAEEALVYIDQLPDLARGMSLDQHAAMALAIKDTRDAVSALKPRLTNAQQKCDEWFAMRIAEHTGEVVHRTATHTFTASAKAFFASPSQIKRPAEFTEMLEWFKANGHGDKIDVSVDGRVSIEGFDEICDDLRRTGKRLPTHVTDHLIDSVVIRRRKGD